jgi:methionyl-tRNA synthetase
VSIFGNFVNRAFVLMHKLCKGRMPALHQELVDDADGALIIEIKNAKVKVETCLEGYKFRDGLFEVIDLARKGNKYMQDKQPWITIKSVETNPDSQKLVDNCLHMCLQLIANLAIIANPFLPFTSKKLCRMMAVVDRMLEWENAGRMDLLKTNYPLKAPELLFKKIEDTEVAAQVEKLQNNLKQATANNNMETKTTEAVEAAAIPLTEKKAEISIDDFMKIDLRVGTILKAEKVEKADKLLRLELDMGNGELRTVVSGIALHYKPEDIIGKQVTVVANLAPRKMKGIESKGMILMAQNNDGKLTFVSPLETADCGSEVR